MPVSLSLLPDNRFKRMLFDRFPGLCPSPSISLGNFETFLKISFFRFLREKRSPFAVPLAAYPPQVGGGLFVARPDELSGRDREKEGAHDPRYKFHACPLAPQPCQVVITSAHPAG